MRASWPMMRADSAATRALLSKRCSSSSAVSASSSTFWRVPYSTLPWAASWDSAERMPAPMAPPSSRAMRTSALTAV
jgi:hypothetical protein